MGKKRDDLGDRMKTYEKVSQLNLTRRMPVVVRLDGKAFHTFTKGLKKPFDENFWVTMRETTKALCENMQNCVLGYCQSDEITLVLIDYYDLNTDVMFGNNVQKLTSISASMCTLYFNKFLAINTVLYFLESFSTHDVHYFDTLHGKINKAMFDSRCFNVPREDVTNCLLWRQNDCYRNSISSVANSMFSHKKLQGKSGKEKLQMCVDEGFDWDSLDDMYKLGTFVMKDENGEFQYRTFNVKENREELNQLFRVYD